MRRVEADAEKVYAVGNAEPWRHPRPRQSANVFYGERAPVDGVVRDQIKPIERVSNETVKQTDAGG